MQTDGTVGRDEASRRFLRLYAKTPKIVDKYGKEPRIRSFSDHRNVKIPLSTVQKKRWDSEKRITV